MAKHNSYAGWPGERAAGPKHGPSSKGAVAYACLVLAIPPLAFGFLAPQQPLYATAGTSLLILSAVLTSRTSALGVMSPFQLFVIGAAPYTLAAPLTVLMGGLFTHSRLFTVDHVQLSKAVLLHALALLAAWGGYIAGTRLQVAPPRRGMRWPGGASIIVAGALIVFAAGALGVLVMEVGGIGALRAVSYGERYTLTRGLGFLAAGTRVAGVGGAVLLLIALRRGSVKLQVLGLSGMFGVLLFWVALTERRRPLIDGVVIVLAMYYMHDRRLSWKALATLAIAIVTYGVGFGLLRAESTGNIASAVGANTAALNPANGEAGAPIVTLIDIMSVVPSEEDFQSGRSYLTVPLVFVPLRLWPNRPPGAAEWYVRRFYPSVWEMGGGFAFSPVAEAYLNFGPTGIPMVFLCVGLLLGLAERRLRSPWALSDTAMLMYALTAPLLLVFFRHDAASLMKEVVVFLLLPVLAARGASRLIWHSVRRHSTSSWKA